MTARKTASEKLQDEALPEVELPEAAKIKPIRTIRLRERQALLDLMKVWMDKNEAKAESGESEIDIASFNAQVAGIQDALEPFALSPDDFIEWSNGSPRGLITLFTGVVQEVGDSMRSAN